MNAFLQNIVKGVLPPDENHSQGEKSHQANLYRMTKTVCKERKHHV